MQIGLRDRALTAGVWRAMWTVREAALYKQAATWAVTQIELLDLAVLIFNKDE